MDGAIAVIGLCSMEVVPKSLAGSAHGLACAVAQGTCTCNPLHNCTVISMLGRTHACTIAWGQEVLRNQI